MGVCGGLLAGGRRDRRRDGGSVVGDAGSELVVLWGDRNEARMRSLAPARCDWIASGPVRVM